MAKCVGSITQWTPKIVDLNEVPFLVDNIKDGEQLVNRKLEEISDLILDIVTDCNLIKISAHDESDKVDCCQVQDSLNIKLEKLGSQIVSTSQKLSASNLISSTKHRYFILFSCGIVEKLKQLLQIVGRISELDESLYLEEQNKPLVSEESIVIHSTTAVWLAAISIMRGLIKPAREIFKEQLDSPEYSFLEQLEFSTAGAKYSKILFMDFTITSWIQFNRLVKYEDLLQKLPFLCPCHSKIYLATLKSICENESNQSFLAHTLPLILDYQSKPSLLTQHTRYCEIIPQEPVYKDSDPANLAYFTIWHIYSVSRIVGDTDRQLISECGQLLDDSFDIAMKQFIPSSQQTAVHLSPHQEERFKLIFVMLNHLCEKNPKKVIIMKFMFIFFDKNWTLFEKYFDNSHFLIEGLTVFQLFTGLLNDAKLLYSTESQANQQISKEEKEMEDIWSKLLARIKLPPIAT